MKDQILYSKLLINQYILTLVTYNNLIRFIALIGIFAIWLPRENIIIKILISGIIIVNALVYMVKVPKDLK